MTVAKRPAMNYRPVVFPQLFRKMWEIFLSIDESGTGETESNDRGSNDSKTMPPPHHNQDGQTTADTRTLRTSLQCDLVVNSHDASITHYSVA